MPSSATSRRPRRARFVRSLELASARYDNGYSDYLDVLDTERGLFNAPAAARSARGDYQRALVNLYRALGGDWNAVPARAWVSSSHRRSRAMNDAAVPAAETTVVEAQPAANPMRKIILIVLLLLLILFIYHVLSDRFTPYTSQARVESFLTQIAPEVAGDVLEVGVKDNGQVRKGQILFRIDPEPYQLAVQAAEANLPVALQGADVSVADVAAARAQIQKQRVDLSANRAINQIVTGLVDKNALARTQEIRSTSDVGKTQADLTGALADLRKAEANLGAPGLRNPKVRQALAALDQARLDLKNTRVVAPAAGIVTNLRLAAGQYVTPGQPLLSFLESGPRWISADLRENQLGNVKPGQDVTVALDVRPGKLFLGKVHSVGSGH